MGLKNEGVTFIVVSPNHTFTHVTCYALKNEHEN
jgi:hypothetical protein